MKGTNDEELRKALKGNIAVKNQFQLTFQSGNYESLVDALFEWLESYPERHGYSKLYEAFCRNINTVESSNEVLETLDAQVFLVLNFETFFKLVLLSVGLMTEDELAQDRLVLADCYDRLLARLQRFQIKPEVIQRFEDTFGNVKHIRNFGAHKYMHDDQLKIKKLGENINSALSGYLIVFYFKGIIETGADWERKAVDAASSPVATHVPATSPVPAPAEPLDLAKVKELVSQGRGSEAIAKATPLAEGGDQETQEYLAKVLANPPKDSGIVKDIQEAVRWNVKLANAGNVKAMHRLGDLYKVSKKYELVIKYYKLAAQKGYVSSLVCLGNLYLTGVTGQGDHTIRQDLSKARDYFRQAFEAGNQDAGNKLKEIDRRMRSAGADSSYIPTAADDIEKRTRTDYEKAFSLLSKGDTDGLRWMKKLACGNDEQALEALRCLVGIYKGGQYGVEKDPAESLRYLMALAKKNDPKALYKLAGYYRGEKNYIAALAWYEKAAMAGDWHACQDLGYLYANGVSDDDGKVLVKVDKAKAFRWYYALAQLGKASAQYILATLYEEGEGTAFDPELASLYYKKAAEQGYQRAIDRLNELNKGA